jgi:hypothetical protein
MVWHPSDQMVGHSPHLCFEHQLSLYRLHARVDDLVNKLQPVVKALVLPLQIALLCEMEETRRHSLPHAIARRYARRESSLARSNEMRVLTMQTSTFVASTEVKCLMRAARLLAFRASSNFMRRVL